ncbi:MAG: hypothetical protein KF799_12495 [Bdellovibrionales bacterium]|nr:hypothetical protein [Bdellovibrionales bacterium]
MLTVSKNSLMVRVFIATMAVFAIGCGKTSNSSSTASTPTGYITCPSTGYYTSNGTTYTCTAGSTVWAGTTTNTGYITCPSTGYYTSNGMTYTCSPGASVYAGSTSTNGYMTCTAGGYYVNNGITYPCTSGSTIYGTGTTTTTSSGYCSQYTAFYGITYVLAQYNGQYVCMRLDIAQAYGYPYSY